jgi:hypothetical protein
MELSSFREAATCAATQELPSIKKEEEIETAEIKFVRM